MSGLAQHVLDLIPASQKANSQFVSRLATVNEEEQIEMLVAAEQKETDPYRAPRYEHVVFRNGMVLGRRI